MTNRTLHDIFHHPFIFFWTFSAKIMKPSRTVADRLTMHCCFEGGGGRKRNAVRNGMSAKQGEFPPFVDVSIS